MVSGCVPQCELSLRLSVCACTKKAEHRVRPLTRVFKYLIHNILKLMGAHGRSHLTSALGAVIDGPLILVLVHNAVVDADTAVNTNAVLNQLVLIRLGGGRRRSRQNTDCLLIVWIPISCYIVKSYFPLGLQVHC